MPTWEPTCQLQQFDNTDKLTDCRLQQRWRLAHPHGADGYMYEWRDIPIVWTKRLSRESA